MAVPSMQNEMDSDTYQMAVRQLDLVAERLGLERDVLARLRLPQRCMVVSVPVQMDNGETQVFIGYRVHHNLVLGPGKGGLRYHPSVSLGDVERPGHVDDVEMCPGGTPLWWCQRGCPL